MSTQMIHDNHVI